VRSGTGLFLNFFEKAGVADCIELINGDALEILPGLHEDFDLVFIDANKEEYLKYYKLVIKRVRPGGYILADNALWGGKVITEPGTDQATRDIQEFNSFVTADQRVENFLLPLRDGIMFIKKL
jgi:predicted O-methyltransferase YrrM